MSNMHASKSRYSTTKYSICGYFVLYVGTLRGVKQCRLTRTLQGPGFRRRPALDDVFPPPVTVRMPPEDLPIEWCNVAIFSLDASARHVSALVTQRRWYHCPMS